MIRRWFDAAASYVQNIFTMAMTIWQAEPATLGGFIAVLILQGLLPLAAAWITKALFDLLSLSILHHHATPSLVSSLIWLLIAQAGLITVAQLISPLEQYLSAELGRQLSLRMQTRVYRKLNNFFGLSHFEDPQFHNTIQLATRGSHMSPLQSLTMVAGLLQSMTTLVAFLGVLIALNPLLASIVSVAVLPELYFQLRFGRQRFGVALSNSPKERRAS